MCGMIRLLLACGTGVLVCLSGTARAQIQQRADGRLLDANTQVGSGGLNRRVAGQPINATRLIITGNVTGGRAFQANSPIRNSNQFFIGLPSSGLDNFRRDTISVADTLGGVNTLFLPRPYFSTGQTIISSGAISRGLNVPGTSIPRNVYQLPSWNPQLSQPRFVSPVQSDADVSPGAVWADRGLAPDAGAPVALSPLGVSARRALAGNNQPNPWVAESSLFASNAALRKRQWEMLQNARPAIRADQPEGDGPKEGLGLLDPRVDRMVDLRIDRRVSAGPARETRDPAMEAARSYGQTIDYSLPGMAALDAARTGYPGAAFSVPGTNVQGVGSGRGATDGDFFRGTMGLPGNVGSIVGEQDGAIGRAHQMGRDYRDRYLQQLRSDLRKQTGSDPAAQPARGGGVPILPAGDPTKEEGIQISRSLPGEFALPLSDNRISDARTMTQERTGQLAELFGDRVVTFVGLADTAINRRLATAEAMMHSGDYFRAAGQYQIAEVLDPAHPLPVLGRAHALLAAGEYYTATRLLIRGINSFPGFGSFRIDLNSFVPDAELLDRRRADLEKRLTATESSEFRFLLGYIEFSMGLTDYGMENLLRAAELAPEGSMIAGFPAMLGLQPDPGDSDPEETESEANFES